jgi:creatinine amidohydrolase
MTSFNAPNNQRRVMAEFLAPHELDAALTTSPVVFIPLGSLEFHSSHLPIGLDALTAHGLCVQAALRSGGVVLPPLYQGIGGGHSSYPWTIMMSSEEGVRAHLLDTLRRLEEFGVRLAVLFTGHFADEQLALIDAISAEWDHGAQGRGELQRGELEQRAGHSLRVIATGVNRNEASPIAPDHAGVFETTLLSSLWPELVHIDRLPPQAERPADDPDGNPAGLHRHDPANSLWGIFGPDPRAFDADQSPELLEAMVSWLCDVVGESLLIEG